MYFVLSQVNSDISRSPGIATYVFSAFLAFSEAKEFCSAATAGSLATGSYTRIVEGTSFFSAAANLAAETRPRKARLGLMRFSLTSL